ncbi:MAG: outer membrane beta-barrel protein [Saprospiraceae bacterium]|uniref:Outer membrane beta-barrel protein n=1 Tax=Candidatus Opimibacter skivensis TaxID=2982028 RepID=A0A9D7XUC9_9BACT|nr:outer membrane beta-barrel protein [Candidatus Opimibacter skivensis]
MPEDRLSSSGRIIVFPQQGLPSYGYGGGFTIALNHPRWAVETGLIYNSKTFEPGRKLSVGTAFDNGTIEFEAMRLQLVTLPLQMRYKVENKGPIKFYALAGFDLNLIVQSDIDVSIKYHFQSLSINENPNSNPNLANTIKESRRVSEHIRDGAPFSPKSFVSCCRFRSQYSLNEHKTFSSRQLLITKSQILRSAITMENTYGLSPFRPV